jgi:hypothetical protein
MKNNNIVILFIYVLGVLGVVPWYWPEGESRLIMGIPLWVLVSLLFALFLSAITSLLLLKAANTANKND